MNRVPPMPHRATVERNTQTELDANRQPKPATYAVHLADLPCFFWETPERPRAGVGTAGLRAGPNIGALIEGTRILVRRDADIRVGDQISSVRDRTGAVITADRWAIVQDLWRQSHRDLGLEAVKATAGVP